jgi:hypothetical protein
VTTTVVKIATALALIGALATSVAAVSLTVKTAADACTLQADRVAKRIVPLHPQAGTVPVSGTPQAVFDRGCFDLSPVG